MGIFDKSPGGLSGSDKLMLLGAALKDFGSGGQTSNILDVQKGFESRAEKARQQKLLEPLIAAFSDQYEDGPPVEIRRPPIVTGINPDAPDSPLSRIGQSSPPFGGASQTTYTPPKRLPQKTLNDPQVQQALIAASLGGANVSPLLSILQAGKPEKPQLIEGPDGIYSVGPDGAPTKIQSYPEKGPTVSPGWEIDPSGGWRPVKNGPYDPEYIARTSGVRRDAVISRPMPRVGGGRGGGGGSSGGGKPWQRYKR